ncbi:hypothetical protein [Adhaeretor mobilis]|uniref:hypothetical protein n=1 Tax=Adhaeretor mobilis TaxID=1930276 RepID=UPI0011AB1E19|nr:hypothetical protein [Adhaeretor mobilis]
MILGCGKGDDFARVVVKGAITFEEVPIENGMIRFVPLAGTSAPVSGSAIVNGKYLVDAKGGVPIGQYKVEIRRSETLNKQAAQSAEDNDSPSTPVSTQEMLPVKYNTKSQLEISIAPESGALVKDFHLTR